jgi:release factor glutamine methyltransferase
MLARTADSVGSRVEATWMCRRASGTDATEFVGIIDTPVTERAGSHLAHLVARRLTGEPIQYVLGSWEFRRVELMVDRRVLIPRPETELMVDHALARLAERGRDAAGGSVAVVADLGTGSGAIGLSLLAESARGSRTVWMTDLSDASLDVARANAAGLGMAGVGARFAAGSWWDALPGDLEGCLDLVCANPPYIADGDPEVADEVLAWEPHGALFAGPDGLDAIRTIVAGAPRWLAAGAAIILEIGHRQGTDVSALMVDAGLVDVEILPDAAGRDRFVVGVRPRASDG